MTTPVQAPARVAAIDAESLSKSFGKVRAVDGISLRVEPGEIVAFLAWLVIFSVGAALTFRRDTKRV
ncbi:MAG: hypothetical protein V4479_14235 [Actinomycetota bacterium]